MIATVTLNPALDRILSVDRLEVGEANRVVRLSDAAAGKGVDVTKVLRDLGEEVVCTGFLGGPVAGVFTDCFARIGARNEFVPIAGVTRTNLQLFDAEGVRTELLEQGPAIDGEEWAALLKKVRALAPECGVVTVCGSAPQGVGSARYRELLRTIRDAGAALIVDASGPLLRLALEERPRMIKPNRSEMRELMGDPDAGVDAIRRYAVELARGGVDYVLVSLGGEGALLACGDGCWQGGAPEVPVKSTLGCGDTMVASMALSLERGLPPEEMLRRAIALSSANAMTFETARVDPREYRRLLERTELTRLD